jgi:hypothetical protein
MALTDAVSSRSDPLAFHAVYPNPTIFTGFPGPVAAGSPFKSMGRMLP